MYFLVYDAKGQLRDEGGSWPMVRAALDTIIAETPEPFSFEGCPRLEIMPDPEIVLGKNRIGILRREAGLNQKELGQKLGVGQTTVSAWETGKNEPDYESLHKMARMFHVSLGYLAGYEEDTCCRL